MTQAAMLQDSDELEALFDTVAAERKVESAPAPAKPVLEAVPATAPATAAPAHACDAPAAPPGDVNRVIHRVGQLTRVLHDSLCELGYDRMIVQAAATIPDARDRLSYVAMMTEQAATRALNAIELARPLQDDIGSEAKRLAELWDRMHARGLTFEEFKALLADTRGYFAAVPAKTEATNAQLTEIMMAQDFQDLTGQVIKKVADIVQRLERELVQLLLDCIPAEHRNEAAKKADPQQQSLLNGPVIAPKPGADVVTSQDQVDDLLESLGF